jgi:soluble lytic murein transglycosylase
MEFGDTDLVLAAYNAGSGNVSKWLADSELSPDGKVLDRVPFKETEKYIKKVRNSYIIYKKLYENEF